MADVVYFGEGIQLPCCAADNEDAAYTLLSSTTGPLTLSGGTEDNIIFQGGTQSSFTFRLPSQPIDGQSVILTFTNAVTTLTIDGNGHTIIGSNPTTAAIGDRFEYKYYTRINKWVRIKYG